MKPDSALSKKRGPSKSLRRQAAEDAGMSRSKMWRCLQVSNIAKDEFEALVESDNPPTVTELVQIGRERNGLPPTIKEIPQHTFMTCPHCGEVLP